MINELVTIDDFITWVWIIICAGYVFNLAWVEKMLIILTVYVRACARLDVHGLVLCETQTFGAIFVFVQFVVS